MTDGEHSLPERLEAILRQLIVATGALRCTVRIDAPAAGYHVNTPCAEVLAPGAASMLGDGSVDHRRARTIRWIERTRRTLVQGDVFADPAIAPPKALVEQFGARAQMVAPLIGSDDYLFGWVSAHFADGPRAFTPEDVRAIEAAAEAVRGVPGVPMEP